MKVELASGLLVGFLLATARAAAWLLVAPPFSNRMVPTQVKVGLAAALGLAAAPKLAARGVPLETGALLGAAVLQVAIGLALGFVTQVLFSAVQAAGELVDLFGGFTIAQAYDPFSNATASVFGRFYQLLSIVLLFAIDGHLLLVRGFLDSFAAFGLSSDDLGDLARLLTHSLGLLFVAAIEIAGPLLAALFLAEVMLGLLSRAAPQMNVFSLGFPFKILLTLLLAGVTLPLLPQAVSSLLHDALRSTAALARALGG